MENYAPRRLQEDSNKMRMIWGIKVDVVEVLEHS